MKEPTYEEIGKLWSLSNAPDHAGETIPLHEMDRLIDLIEFPTKSGILEPMRKASIGANFEEMRKHVRWLQTEQDESELREMLTVIKGSKSLLEVGSRFGGTLFRMSEVLKPNSKVVSVDYPAGDKTPCIHKPKECLFLMAEKIKGLGHDCILIDADSQNPETVEKVKGFAPFDFGFIDADHSYEGVKRDWENYGPMCKTVGFHDIAGADYGSVAFWKELKTKHRHLEFINPKANLGIGIIWR